MPTTDYRIAMKPILFLLFNLSLLLLLMILLQSHREAPDKIRAVLCCVRLGWVSYIISSKNLHQDNAMCLLAIYHHHQSCPNWLVILEQFRPGFGETLLATLWEHGSPTANGKLWLHVTVVGSFVAFLQLLTWTWDRTSSSRISHISPPLHAVEGRRHDSFLSISWDKALPNFWGDGIQINFRVVSS